MSEYTIYHNPRCSKSRNTLALLEEKGIQPEVVLYLETAPDEGEIAIEDRFIQRGMAATRYFGAEPRLGRGSTDSNIPISLGI